MQKIRSHGLFAGWQFKPVTPDDVTIIYSYITIINIKYI